MKKKLKNSVCFLLCLVIFLMSTLNAAAKNEDLSVDNPFILGDIDGDGQVTLKDARLCLRAAVHIDEATPKIKRAANVYFDFFKFSVANARVILRIAVHIDDLTHLYAVTPQSSAALSEEQKEQITNDWISTWTGDYLPETPIVDFDYYGAYNGRIVLGISDNNGIPTLSGSYHTLEWFTFHYADGMHLVVWENGSFTRIDHAYEQRLLSIEDVKSIYYRSLEVLKCI